MNNVGDCVSVFERTSYKKNKTDTSSPCSSSPTAIDTSCSTIMLSNNKKTTPYSSISNHSFMKTINTTVSPSKSCISTKAANHFSNKTPIEPSSSIILPSLVNKSTSKFISNSHLRIAKKHVSSSENLKFSLTSNKIAQSKKINLLKQHSVNTNKVIDLTWIDDRAENSSTDLMQLKNLVCKAPFDENVGKAKTDINKDDVIISPTVLATSVNNIMLNTSNTAVQSTPQRKTSISQSRTDIQLTQHNNPLSKSTQSIRHSRTSSNTSITAIQSILHNKTTNRTSNTATPSIRPHQKSSNTSSTATQSIRQNSTSSTSTQTIRHNNTSNTATQSIQNSKTLNNTLNIATQTNLYNSNTSSTATLSIRKNKTSNNVSSTATQSIRLISSPNSQSSIATPLIRNNSTSSITSNTASQSIQRNSISNATTQLIRQSNSTSNATTIKKEWSNTAKTALQSIIHSNTSLVQPIKNKPSANPTCRTVYIINQSSNTTGLSTAKSPNFIPPVPNFLPAPKVNNLECPPQAATANQFVKLVSVPVQSKSPQNPTGISSKVVMLNLVNQPDNKQIYLKLNPSNNALDNTLRKVQLIQSTALSLKPVTSNISYTMSQLAPVVSYALNHTITASQNHTSLLSTSNTSDSPASFNSIPTISNIKSLKISSEPTVTSSIPDSSLLITNVESLCCKTSTSKQSVKTCNINQEQFSMSPSYCEDACSTNGNVPNEISKVIVQNLRDINITDTVDIYSGKSDSWSYRKFPVNNNFKVKFSSCGCARADGLKPYRRTKPIVLATDVTNTKKGVKPLPVISEYMSLAKSKFTSPENNNSLVQVTNCTPISNVTPNLVVNGSRHVANSRKEIIDLTVADDSEIQQRKTVGEMRQDIKEAINISSVNSSPKTKENFNTTSSTLYGIANLFSLNTATTSVKTATLNVTCLQSTSMEKSLSIDSRVDIGRFNRNKPKRLCENIEVPLSKTVRPTVLEISNKKGSNSFEQISRTNLALDRLVNTRKGWQSTSFSSQKCICTLRDLYSVLLLERQKQKIFLVEMLKKIKEREKKKVMLVKKTYISPAEKLMEKFSMKKSLLRKEKSTANISTPVKEHQVTKNEVQNPSLPKKKTFKQILEEQRKRKLNKQSENLSNLNACTKSTSKNQSDSFNKIVNTIESVKSSNTVFKHILKNDSENSLITTFSKNLISSSITKQPNIMILQKSSSNNALNCPLKVDLNQMTNIVNIVDKNVTPPTSQYIITEPILQKSSSNNALNCPLKVDLNQKTNIVNIVDKNVTPPTSQYIITETILQKSSSNNALNCPLKVDLNQMTNIVNIVDKNVTPPTSQYIVTEPILQKSSSNNALNCPLKVDLNQKTNIVNIVDKNVTPPTSQYIVTEPILQKSSINNALHSPLKVDLNQKTNIVNIVDKNVTPPTSQYIVTEPILQKSTSNNALNCPLKVDLNQKTNIVNIVDKNVTPPTSQKFKIEPKANNFTKSRDDEEPINTRRRTSILRYNPKDPLKSAEERALQQAIALSLKTANRAKRKVEIKSATCKVEDEDLSKKKKRPSEVDQLVDTHWNESGIRADIRSPTEKSSQGNETREQKKLHYALARIAEMEHKKQQRNIKSFSPLQPPPAKKIRIDASSTRTCSQRANIKRRSLVHFKDSSYSNIIIKSKCKQRSQIKKSTTFPSATSTTNVSRNVAKIVPATSAPKRNMQNTHAAVSTTTSAKCYISTQQTTNTTLAQKKEYILVPKYKGFKDFTPIVVDSKTRRQTTSSERDKLKKQDFPLMVVEKIGDKTKQVIIKGGEDKNSMIKESSIQENETYKSKNLSVNRNTGETVLHKSARLGYAEVAESKIREGANVHARDHAGWTALHEACAFGHETVAHILLKNGADPNCVSNTGIRPIHDACEKGHIHILRLLLSYGADHTVASYSGYLPINCTRDENLKTFLQEYSISQSLASESNNKPLPWRFEGSCKLLDTIDCSDIFSDVPPCTQLYDQVEMEFTNREMLTTFYLPYTDENGLVKGYRNYHILKDVLDRLSCSRNSFLLRHPKLEMRNMTWIEFQQSACQSALNIMPDPPVCSSHSEEPQVELVYIGHYTYRKLFNVKSRRVDWT